MAHQESPSHTPTPNSSSHLCCSSISVFSGDSGSVLWTLFPPQIHWDEVSVFLTVILSTGKFQFQQSGLILILPCRQAGKYWIPLVSLLVYTSQHNHI